MEGLLYILPLITSLALQTSAGSAPQISHIGNTLKAVTEKKVLMECPVTGDPTPTITWDKDGTPFHQLSDRFTINRNTKALRIYPVQLEDFGNYTCTATNQFGVDTFTITLFVMLLRESHIVSPTNLTFMESTNQELVCQTRAHPRPFFEWLTNSHPRIRVDPIQGKNSSSRRLYSIEREVGEILYESVLYLQPVTYKDHGSFACIAFNDIGHSRVSGSLNVLFSPKVLSQHSSHEPVVWWEGQSTNLSCIVAGNDVPKVTWFRNKKPFTCNKLQERVGAAQITSSCVIQDRRDGGPGVYSCHAKNNFGETPVHEFHVRENFPPAAVEFTPVSMQLDEVVLSVKIPTKRDTPPATYVLASYKLAADTGDKPNPEYERMGDVNKQGEGTVKLVGVRENSEYVVKVSARNSVGFGPTTVSLVNTAIQSIVTKTTVQSSSVTTDVLGYFSIDESASNDDDKDIEEELTNEIEDDDNYGLEREGPEALGVRSSCSTVTVTAGSWCCQAKILFVITWFGFVFRLHYIS